MVSPAQQTEDKVTTIATIFGKKNEKKRRLRLHGRGVTCTQLKQREFQEQLQRKKDEEVKVIEAESHMQQHNPDMPPVDPTIFGSLLGDVSSAMNVSGATGSQIGSTSRHLHTSTSTDGSYEQDAACF